MARRSSSPALMLVGLGVLAATAAVILLVLSEEPGSGGGSAPLGSGEAEVRTTDVPAPLSGEEAQPRPLRADGSEPSPRDDGPSSSNPDGVRRVSGVVLRLSDRSPVMNARVNGRHGETHTTAEGRFILDEVGRDERSLQLTRAIQTKWLDLPDEDGDLHELEFVVDTGWILEGHVRGEAGEPVPGALVAVFEGSRRRSPVAFVRVGPDGQFSLRDVLPGDGSVRLLTVEARGDLHAPVQRSARLPEDDRWVSGLEFTLPAAGAVEGVVHDPSGKPLRHLVVSLPLVRAEGWIDDAPAGLSAATDDEGRYRIGGVPAGEYVALLSMADPLEHLDKGGTVVTMIDGRPGVVVETGRSMTLDWIAPLPCRVEGRVIDSAGNPWEDARVEAHWELAMPAPDRFASWSAKLDVGTSFSRESPQGGVELVLSLPTARTETDAAGQFGMGRVTAGTVRVTASAPAQVPAEQVLALAPGQEFRGLDLMLGAGLSLSGRVVDEAGRALGDARVLVVERSHAFTYDESDFVPVDADGRFEIGGLSPGEHTLLARSPGHRDALLHREAGAPAVRIQLTPAPVLAVQVLDGADGSPVPEYHVRIEDEAMFMETGIEDAEGRVQVDSLGEGAYTVSVTASGFRPEQKQGVTLRTGETTEVTFLLRR
jgi:hypothetical protein